MRKVKICSGAYWKSRDDMPPKVRKYYPKKPPTPQGYSCSNVCGFRSGLGSCAFEVRDGLLPPRCPFSLEDYNKLPEISMRKLLNIYAKGEGDEA